MPVKKIAALGWENCVEISNGVAELLITTDVGPRILSYKLKDGPNLLRIFPDQTGKSGEKEFVGRGGHRLWVSPENDRTYVPDNSAVEWQPKEPHGVHLVTPATDPWLVRREMTVSLAAENSTVLIQHRIANESREPITVASWGLTIMTPGGVEIIPQPPLGTHGDEFLPNRVIVPWTYTDLSDPRWKLGRRFFILTPKPDAPPTKLGLSHRERWVGYVLPTTLYVKTFDYEDGALYPDLGCNFETFSKGDFIELETLGPLRELKPGEAVGHTETWHLFGGITPPDFGDESALERWISPFLTRIGAA